MHFIILFRFRKKLSRDDIKRFEEIIKSPPSGLKPYGMYFTLGSYDAVWHVEADDAKQMTNMMLSLADIVSSETLAAVPLSEAAEMLS